MFIASGDKSFGITGAESKITYWADYIARKRILEKLRLQSPRQYHDLIEFWKDEVYAGMPLIDDDSNDESPFDSAPADPQEAEMLELMGDELGDLGADSDDELNPANASIQISDNSGFRSDLSRASSLVPTLPPTPIPARTGALARNEPLFYPDLDRDSNTSTRGQLSREPTVRAFAPALSPSTLMTLSASAPGTIESDDLFGDSNDVTTGIQELTINTINEGSASARGRAAGARGIRRNGPAANLVTEPRPTRITRARTATAKS